MTTKRWPESRLRALAETCGWEWFDGYLPFKDAGHPRPCVMKTHLGVFFEPRNGPRFPFDPANDDGRLGFAVRKSKGWRSGFVLTYEYLAWEVWDISLVGQNVFVLKSVVSRCKRETEAVCEAVIAAKEK